MEEAIRSDLPAPAQKKRFGWVKWCILAACLVFVIAAVLLLLRPKKYGSYYFDKDRYPVIATAMTDRAGPNPQDIDGFNRLIHESSEGEYLIAECTVSGGSYNVIHYSNNWETGFVLTPIRINKIHYKTPTLSLSNGETCYLVEEFFYIDETTPIRQSYANAEEGICRIDRYNPVYHGEKYIMFLQFNNSSREGSELTMIDADDKLFNPIGSDSAGLYQIADPAEVEKNLLSVNWKFWKNWTYVMETYANYPTDNAPTDNAPTDPTPEYLLHPPFTYDGTNLHYTDQYSFSLYTPEELTQITDGSAADEALQNSVNADIHFSSYSIKSYETLIARQETPLLTYATTQYWGSEFGPHGLYIDWSNYIDKMPNVHCVLSQPQHEGLLANHAEEDGSIYSLPFPGTENGVWLLHDASYDENIDMDQIILFVDWMYSEVGRELIKHYWCP